MDEGHRAQALYVHAVMIGLGAMYNFYDCSKDQSREYFANSTSVSHLDCPMLLYLPFLQKILQVFFSKKLWSPYQIYKKPLESKKDNPGP